MRNNDYYFSEFDINKIIRVQGRYIYFNSNNLKLIKKEEDHKQDLNKGVLDLIRNLLKLDNDTELVEQLKNIQNRLISAYIINKNYKIKPQALELKIGTNFTYDTLKKLKTIMPRVNFIWIMGADNLYNMERWYKWRKIFYLCPIVVVNREGYFKKSLSSKPAKYFWKKKIDITKLTNNKNLPVWSYLNIKPNLNSSTNLRKNIG